MSTIVRRLLARIPPDTVVRVVRGPLRGCRWVTGSAPHGAWLGRLEAQTLADFAAHVRPGSVVWDVGANVGLFTLTAARRTGPTGHTVAFEPVPRNIAFLRRHLELNHCTNTTIVEAAVTSTTGRVRMAPGASPSEFAVRADGPLDVPCTTLDEWHAASPLGPPSVIKIDTEGAEAEVLQGATDVFRSARPRLYLAVHGDAVAARCRHLLDAWSYRVTTVDGQPPDRSSEWIAEPPSFV